MPDAIGRPMPRDTNRVERRTFIRCFDGSPRSHWQYDGQVSALFAVYSARKIMSYEPARRQS